MKKLFLISAFLLICSILFSQVKVVVMLPKMAQGYLVLKKPANLGVVYWKVDLIKRTFDEKGSYTDAVTNSYFLNNTDYMKFSDEILKGDIFYLITARGYNSIKEEVVVDGPNIIVYTPPGPQFQLICKNKCVGTTYAYELDFIKKEGVDQSYISMQSTSTDNINENGLYIPYYQYMSPAQFQAVSAPGTHWSDYYNVPGWWNNGFSVVQLPNNTNTVYCDNQSNPITSPLVWAVQKHTGDWTGSGDVISTPYLTLGSSVCSNPTSWFVNVVNSTVNVTAKINAWGLHMPSLSCYGSACLDPGDIPFGGSGVTACVLALLHSGDPDMTSLIHALNKCLFGIEIDDYVKLPANVNSYRISDPSGNSEPITISNDILFKSNGEYSGFKFSLNPGLYVFGIQLKNGQYIPLMKEVTKASTYEPKLKDFLKSTIFPVPVQGNEFEIKMNASAKVKFDYVLYDFYGNELFRKNFVIQKDQERTFTVKPNSPIPSGILINNFIFEDGSQLSIKTSKN